ncbi:MAG TPA: hypothetical protein VFP05_18180 [Thermomicrobiales bacterium]|nr:hypothetical protein [Thermomicrobiales bacterium]
MDDRRFDSVTQAFAKSGSRRALLKALLGFGAVAAASMTAIDDVDAARRGYSGPRFPIEPPLSECPGLECNGQCCDQHDTVCCGGFCCSGGCHETECCGRGSTFCGAYGCCPGVCIEDGQNCCPQRTLCNGACCGEGAYCCEKADGSQVCTQTGRCCNGLQCPGGRCDSEGFCH